MREGQGDSDDVSGLRTLVGLRQAQETCERLPDVLREVRIVVQARHVCRIFQVIGVVDVNFLIDELLSLALYPHFE